MQNLTYKFVFLQIIMLSFPSLPFEHRDQRRPKHRKILAVPAKSSHPRRRPSNETAGHQFPVHGLRIRGYNAASQSHREGE